MQTMSSGSNRNITQSLKSAEITSTDISASTRVKIATPPRGVNDSTGFDLAMNKKSLGHLSRMFKCVSLMMTTSYLLKSSCTSVVKNLFLIPFIFQHKILHSTLKSCKLALRKKTNWNPLSFHPPIIVLYQFLYLYLDFSFEDPSFCCKFSGSLSYKQDVDLFLYKLFSTVRFYASMRVLFAEQNHVWLLISCLP